MDRRFLLAVRATGDMALAHMAISTLLCGGAVICAAVYTCGLAAGLYRDRYLRGNRDEVAGVALANILATCLLTGVGLALSGGRGLLPETVPGLHSLW